jgi:2-polyprenyl-3-methyl-5-hydroxy-6-metoxy-1,4-benzoquinol methylase
MLWVQFNSGLLNLARAVKPPALRIFHCFSPGLFKGRCLPKKPRSKDITMGLDLVDLMLEGLFGLPPDSDDFVKKPHPLRNGSGQALNFTSLPDLARATIHYAVARRKNDYRAASDLLSGTIQTLEIERLSLLFKQLIFERLQLAFPDLKDLSPHELVLGVYAEYVGCTVEKISAIKHSATENVSQVWREQYEKCEDTLTSEQLANFYASFEFPIMCTFRKILRSSFPVAHAALPLYFAQQCGATAAFDYGGNSGLLTSALALTGVNRVLLIDQLPSLLDFAKWRDQRMNLTNVAYMRADTLESAIDRFTGAFDFGSCTEVLEHVADVEAALAILAKLLRKSGILFLSTSFNHYPYPTHLRRNLVYAGKEDDLLQRFGFQRLNVKFPVPTRGNERLYRKVI